MQYLTEVICFLSFNKQKITVKKVFKPPKLTLSHFDNILDFLVRGDLRHVSTVMLYLVAEGWGKGVRC